MKGDDIFERLVCIAVKTVRIVETLPATATAKHLGQQLVRSATAGGANYQEARGAESRNDFAHKLGVALKETREAHYWLRVVAGLEMAERARSRPFFEKPWSSPESWPARSARPGRALLKKDHNREQGTEDREQGTGNGTGNRKLHDSLFPVLCFPF